MSLALTVPRVLSDAVAVCADPGAYADRPSLLMLARQVLMSAAANSAAPPLDRTAHQPNLLPPVRQ